ncbi:MAG: arginine repressor [Actinobacteria bacterium]|nr:arginine repressor [Actinomycetota bacterium]
MKRSERLKAIREIIKNSKISSQEKLISELEKKGFNITQATVSRDIQFLNLVKVRDAQQNEYYSLSSKFTGDPQFGIAKVKSKFGESVISVERAHNIIVIKTNPGEAQGVAASIDGSNFDEILGTVAGDDTIICVIENHISAGKIVNLFRGF